MCIIEKRMTKEAPVPQIIAENKTIFDRSKTTVTTPGRFPLQPEALRYMLIPERLLTLAPDPGAIDVIPIGQSATEIEALVVARPFTPIVDRRGRTRMLRPPNKPSNIALHQARLVREGKLQSGGEALLYLHMIAGDNGQLSIESLDDRPQLHELGIVTSLYERLRETGRELGFRFIVGINDTERSLRFFKKRGRYSLDQILPDKQSTFEPLPEDIDSYRNFTIDFLHQDDIRQFVAPKFLRKRQ